MGELDTNLIEFENQFEKKYKVVLDKYNKAYSEIKINFQNFKQNI